MSRIWSVGFFYFSIGLYVGIYLILLVYWSVGRMVYWSVCLLVVYWWSFMCDGLRPQPALPACLFSSLLENFPASDSSQDTLESTQSINPMHSREYDRAWLYSGVKFGIQILPTRDHSTLQSWQMKGPIKNPV